MTAPRGRDRPLCSPSPWAEQLWPPRGSGVSPAPLAHARAAGVNREPCLEHPAAGKDFVPLLVAIALGRDSEEPFNLLTVTAFLLRPVNPGSSWCAHSSRTRF